MKSFAELPALDHCAGRVLIVEQDEEYAVTLMNMLNPHEYQIVVVSDLQAARQALEKFEAEVLLVDMRLIRQQQPNVLHECMRLRQGMLCLVTATPSERDAAILLLAEGIYGYLLKPVDSLELQAIMLRCFEKLHLEQEKALVEHALSIKNQELDEINRRLRAIVKSTGDFSTCVKIDRMGKYLLEQFAQSMAAEGGSLYLIEQDALVLTHALDPGHAPAQIPFPLQAGTVFEKAIREKRPILMRDIEHEGSMIKSGWSGYRNGSILVFPLPSVTGEILGLLTLHNKVCPPFTLQDLEIGLILAFYSCEVLRATSALEELQASERRYRTIFENIQDMYFELLLDGTLVEISPSVSSVLLYSREDICDKPLRELFANPAEKSRFHEQIIFQRKLTDYEISLVDKHGVVAPCSVTAQLLLDEQGNPWKICGTLRDIRARKQSESALLHLNKELEQRVQARTAELEEANRGLRDALDMLNKTQEHLVQSEKMVALGHLVAGVTHEISTPIGIGVTAVSHLVQQSEAFEQQFREGKIHRSELEQFLRTASESSKIIFSNLRRAAEHISGFKQMAVDQASGRRRSFNLFLCINDVLLSLHPKLRHTQHTVRVRCPEDLEVYSYPGAFSQIITNFIINTLLHGFEQKNQGIIDLEVTFEKNILSLRYYDNGKGIAEEECSRIFEPFYTTKPEQGGAGLGLAIVYNIVTQQLQGRIECESHPGEGITFTIRVPLMNKGETVRRG